MKKFITFTLALLLSLPMFSQRDETALHNPDIKLTGIWGGGISRIHNFSNDIHYANGSFFTFEINKNFLIGWDGFTVNASNPEIEDINVSSSGLLLGYAYRGYKVIHPVAYVSLGRAKSKAEALPTIRSFAAHTSVGAEVNIFRWFRIGGEVGYRYINDPDDTWVGDAGLSSPYVGLKLKFGWSWGK